MFLKARKINLRELNETYSQTATNTTPAHQRVSLPSNENPVAKTLEITKQYTETGMSNEIAAAALDMLVDSRYKLTRETRVTSNIVGDYCTLLFFVLSKIKLESCPPKALYAKICTLLSKCIEGDGFIDMCEEAEAEKLQWVMECLYKTSEISEYYTEECLGQYMDCVDSCSSLIFETMHDPTACYKDLEKDECSSLWLTNDHKSVTVKFIDSVEPRMTGLLKSVSYIRYVLGDVDCTRRKVTFSREISSAILLWLVSNFNEVDHDQFTTNMYNTYLENDVLPGEAFYYNKITHFIPNSPREVLEKVRPQAFQDILKFISANVMDMFTLEPGKNRKNSAFVENRTFSKAREAALYTAAKSAISRDCGVPIKNNLMSYSKFECYGKDRLTNNVKYPAIFSLGCFYVLSTESEVAHTSENPVLYCDDVLTAIGLLVARLSNDGNQRATLLCRSWGFK